MMSLKQFHHAACIVIGVGAFSIGCVPVGAAAANISKDKSVREHHIEAARTGGSLAQDKAGRILSAFFGLDRSLRIALAARRACEGNPGSDRMPVIFSREVDASTLDPEDFRITTASGRIGDVRCVTLQPADEPGELRTALLIGYLGSASDQPVRVEIVGDIEPLDGAGNFRGMTSPVIPLKAGPTLILAETLPQEAWNVGKPDGCPADGLVTIVRATWVGGITRPGGGEIGAAEARMYRVTLQQADGSIVTAAPMAVADLNDSDNNHELCLGVPGTPQSVFFPAGALTDPNEDLNPDTEIAVSVPPYD